MIGRSGIILANVSATKQSSERSLFGQPVWRTPAFGQTISNQLLYHSSLHFGDHRTGMSLGTLLLSKVKFINYDNQNIKKLQGLVVFQVYISISLSPTR